MIRVLHTADLHLDAPFPSFGERDEERREDFFKTFERLLNLAIKNEVRLFVVAGDLFDSPRPSSTAVARVQAGFKRLQDRGIVPVVLPGTHDSVAFPDSVYRRAEFPGTVLLDSPSIDEPVCLPIDGEDVWLYGFAFQNFASADAFESMKRRCPDGIHIGLLHGSRQGSPEWEYRKKDLPFTLPALKSWGLDYVALGHYHSFEILEDSGRIYACYPGSPEGKRFGENGSRYCSIVTISQEKVSIEKLQVNTRTLEDRDIDLTGCENSEQAATLVCESSDDGLILRLILKGIIEAPIDINTLHARCNGSFYHLQLIDETRLFDSGFARRIEREETIRGLFVRRARKLMEESSPDMKPLIEEAFREILVRFRAFGRENG